MGCSYSRDLSDIDAPTYFPYGTFRRRIRLVADSSGVVEGGIEDDQHYFKVRLRHDDTRVLSIESESVRAPGTTGADAAVPLRALAGMPLSIRCLAVTEWTESVDHCTHQLDLVGLAVAHAARAVAGGAPTRQYDAEVPFGLLQGEEHAVTLALDGTVVLRWTMRGRQIVAPRPYSEASGGFARWADTTLAPDDAEAAV